MCDRILRDKRKLPYVVMALLVSISLGTILMIMVYNLPVSRIRSHARESIPILKKEKDYYNPMPGYKGAKLDGFTDSLMINSACFWGTDSPVKDAMMNPYVMYEENAGGVFSKNLIDSLAEETAEGATIIHYPRYWHGYLLWLKPAMEFFNLQEIRMINISAQLMLFLIVAFFMYRRMGKRFLAVFAGTICLIFPVSIALCLQHSCLYDITLLTLAVVLLMPEKEVEKNAWKVFLWCGISTAFFDLFTAPLMAFGIPLAVCLVLTDGTLKRQIRLCLSCGVLWAVGYIGMWGGKWIVSYLLTGYNTISDARAAIQVRTGEKVGNDQIGSMQVIRRNLEMLNTPVLYVFLAVGILIVVYLLVSRRYGLRLDSRMVMLASVAVLPLLWYSLVKNHSAIHYWMTYRSLSVTWFAIGCAVCQMVVKKNASLNITGTQQDIRMMI